MCQNQILFFQSSHKKYHRSFNSTIGTNRFSRSDCCQHFLEPESDLNSDLCGGFGRHIQDAEHVQSLGRWYFCTYEGKCHQKSTMIWNFKDKPSLYYPFLHYIVQCETKASISYITAHLLSNPCTSLFLKLEIACSSLFPRVLATQQIPTHTWS